MFNKKESLKSILSYARRKRRGKLNDELDNVLFLDYDGVINLDPNNYGKKCFDRDCIENVNRLCKKFNLKIVVISSWKKYENYEGLL